MKGFPIFSIVAHNAEICLLKFFSPLLPAHDVRYLGLYTIFCLLFLEMIQIHGPETIQCRSAIEFSVKVPIAPPSPFTTLLFCS